MLKLDVVFSKAEGTITFLKAVAAVTLQKAVATITFGQFIIFKEFTDLATAIDVLTTNTNKILQVLKNCLTQQEILPNHF